MPYKTVELLSAGLLGKVLAIRYPKKSYPWSRASAPVTNSYKWAIERQGVV